MEWLILWALFAIFSAVIASSKNRDAAGWFFLGLLLGPFGLLVAALPKIEPESQAQAPADTRSCPRCKETIKSNALMCRFCKLEFPFVDATVREHLLRIKSLLQEGLSNDQVAGRLNTERIKCLTNDGVWNAELIAKIRSDFALNHS